MQPLNGENTNHLINDDGKPDIRARNVWINGQNAFFNIRITNTNANSQSHQSPTKILEIHEKEKKRQYKNRVMNIEHGTFTLLVFSISGHVGKECSIFHKLMFHKIATKQVKGMRK